MKFSLYSVQDDGSKVLLSGYDSLENAENAMTDNSITYSIEQWDGCFATILF